MHEHANGERYEGAFANGRKNGYGVWLHPAGDKYAGMRLPLVIAVSLFLKSSSASGEFMNDVRHGMGTYTTARGQVWSGEWRDGKQFKKMDTYADQGALQRLNAGVKQASAGVDVGYGVFTGVVGESSRSIERFLRLPIFLCSFPGRPDVGGASDTYLTMEARKQPPRPAQGMRQAPAGYDSVAGGPGRPMATMPGTLCLSCLYFVCLVSLFDHIQRSTTESNCFSL